MFSMTGLLPQMLLLCIQNNKLKTNKERNAYCVYDTLYEVNNKM